MRYLFYGILGLLCITTLFAKDFKIGYIDVDYVLKNYRGAIDAQRAFETEINRYKKNADSLKTLYENAQKELESQLLMLSEQGKNVKMMEVGQLKKKYDDYVAEIWGKGGRIEQKNKELINPIVQTIQSAVKKIAEKQGFSLILDASESKIIYAQTGLDLTDMVLTELNKEYAPTIIPPTTGKDTTKGTASPGTTPLESLEKKINIGVFPIYDENQEAKSERIGEQIRTAIYEIIRSFSNIRIISAVEINNAMISRSLDLFGQIQDRDAGSIGRMLQTHYLVLGSCSKQGNKITFQLRLFDPNTEETVYQGQGEAARIEEIKPALGSVIQQAIRTGIK
ncbi:MAG: OmpH family outer membrane protein [candidate division WOR-3 bacterium]|nr:OmpH family outer membrane protein [candidate division WOR-3 bacterium]